MKEKILKFLSLKLRKVVVEEEINKLEKEMPEHLKSLEERLNSAFGQKFEWIWRSDYAQLFSFFDSYSYNFSSIRTRIYEARIESHNNHSGELMIFESKLKEYNLQMALAEKNIVNNNDVEFYCKGKIYYGAKEQIRCEESMG